MNNNNSSPRVQSFALTDQGRRPNNEDFIKSFEPTDLEERQKSGCVYIVADGVGGAAIGERASKFATEKVLYEYLQHPELNPASRLKQAIVKANREIFEYAEQNGIRMATTMTVAVILGNRLIAANVGDSRVYLIRGGEVRQITEDHNVVGELVRNGVMTEAEALKSKSKNKLTRSIGGNDEVQADTFEDTLQPDDRILLCSDGLTRYALKEDIARFATSNSPKQIVTDAIDFAKKRGHGGADNISVITVAYEPTEPTGSKPAETSKAEEEWESRATEFEIKKHKPVPYLPLAILAIVLIGFLVTAGGAAFLFRDRILSFMQYQSSTPSGASLLETAIASPSAILALSTTETPTATATSTNMPTSTATSTGEPTATETFTSTPTPTDQIPITLVQCLYTVVPGDNLSKIASRFGIGTNYKEITCALNLENRACNLENPANIRSGWQVVIPGVDQNICSLNSGTPQPQQ